MQQSNGGVNHGSQPSADDCANAVKENSRCTGLQFEWNAGNNRCTCYPVGTVCTEHADFAVTMYTLDNTITTTYTTINAETRWSSNNSIDQAGTNGDGSDLSAVTGESVAGTPEGIPERKSSGGVAGGVVTAVLVIALVIGIVVFRRRKGQRGAIPTLHFNHHAANRTVQRTSNGTTENAAFSLREPKDRSGRKEDPYLIVDVIPATSHHGLRGNTARDINRYAGSGGGGGGRGGDDGGPRTRSASVVAKSASNNQIYSIPFDDGDGSYLGIGGADDQNDYLVPHASKIDEGDEEYDMPDASAKFALPTSASGIVYAVPDTTVADSKVVAAAAGDEEYDMPDASAKFALPTSASGIVYAVPDTTVVDSKVVAAAAGDEEYDMPDAAAKTALPTSASGVTYSTYTSGAGVYSIPVEGSFDADAGPAAPAEYSAASDAAQVYRESADDGGVEDAMNSSA